MQPLRIKASSTPPSSANFQGLQEMSDAEINQYLSYVITNKFADDTDGTGTAELNVDTAKHLVCSLWTLRPCQSLLIVLFRFFQVPGDVVLVESMEE